MELTGGGSRLRRTVGHMPGRPMIVTFRRLGRCCGWTALRPPRTVVPGPTMAAGGDLPHDLATFVIEAGLGIPHGFWGCVADGATFRSLGRARTPQGKAVIARHADALDHAEQRVNAVYFAWRRGEPTELDAELAAMAARWRAMTTGDELSLEWHPQGAWHHTRRRSPDPSSRVRHISTAG